MNARRFLSKAAAGSVLLAASAVTAATSASAAPAQAADLGSALTSTAVTAQAAGQQAGEATAGVLGQYKVGQKVGAVKKAVQGGTDVVNAGNELVN